MQRNCDMVKLLQQQMLSKIGCVIPFPVTTGVPKNWSKSNNYDTMVFILDIDG